MRTVIVEDERASQEALCNYLETYCQEVEVIGVAASIAEAQTLIDAQEPDLVFLDIEMPFGTGFDLLEALRFTSFRLIFVTAYSHYAIRAIRYSATDYLLKPLNIEELVAAVARATKERSKSSDTIKVLLENMKVAQLQKTKIVLPVLDGMEIIRAEEIVCCQAQDNFTHFNLQDGSTPLICRTLKYYEEILEPLGFMRIHKSYLVNLEHIVKYARGKGGSVTLSSGEILPVSPGKKNELIEVLKN